jgi:hypothetical protein
MLASNEFFCEHLAMVISQVIKSIRQSKVPTESKIFISRKGRKLFSGNSGLFPVMMIAAANSPSLWPQRTLYHSSPRQGFPLMPGENVSARGVMSHIKRKAHIRCRPAATIRLDATAPKSQRLFFLHS